MADLNGTKVIAKVVPPTDADTFPTHDEEYGKGGFRSVANEADRLAIPADRRSNGMRVYQVNTGKLYQLAADLTTWNDAILDEDNMASDSDLLPPSQQSAKAYTDNAASAAESNANSYTDGVETAHLAAYDHALLHDRQHAMDSAADHVSPAGTEGNVPVFDAAGYPVDDSGHPQRLTYFVNVDTWAGLKAALETLRDTDEYDDAIITVVDSFSGTAGEAVENISKSFTLIGNPVGAVERPKITLTTGQAFRFIGSNTFDVKVIGVDITETSNATVFNFQNGASGRLTFRNCSLDIGGSSYLIGKNNDGELLVDIIACTYTVAGGLWLVSTDETTGTTDYCKLVLRFDNTRGDGPIFRCDHGIGVVEVGGNCSIEDNGAGIWYKSANGDSLTVKHGNDSYVSHEDLLDGVTYEILRPGPVAFPGAITVSADSPYDIPGYLYQSIKDAADYINATADAPLVIRVMAGEYELEESVIFEKPVLVIGCDIEGVVFRFTYNAANDWVRYNLTHPYYPAYCFYWGGYDPVSFVAEPALMRGTMGIKNATIITQSAGLNPIAGELYGDSGEHVEFIDLHFQQVKEPSRKIDQGAVQKNVIHWETSSNPNSNQPMPGHAIVRDIVATGLSRIPDLLSCAGTTTLTRASGDFHDEISVGSHIIVDNASGHGYKVTAIDPGGLSCTLNGVPGTFTNEEGLALNQFDDGIYFSMFHNSADSNAHFSNLKFNGVMGRPLGFSGIESLKIDNIDCLGCMWRDALGTSAGGRAYIEADYCRLITLQNFTEWRAGVPSGATQNQWNLFNFPSNNGYVSIENVVLRGGSSTNNLYRLIEAGCPIYVEKFIGENYYYSDRGISLGAGCDGSALKGVELKDNTATYGLYIDGAADIILDQVYCESDCYLIGEDFKVTGLTVEDQLTTDLDRAAFTGCKLNGKILQQNGASFPEDHRENVFQGCHFGGAITFDSASVRCFGCTFKHSASLPSGLHRMDYANEFVGNTFVLSDDDYYTFGNVSVITGNTFVFEAGYAPATGNPAVTIDNYTTFANNIFVCNGVDLGGESVLYMDGQYSIVAGNIFNQVSADTVGNYVIECDLTADYSNINGNTLRAAGTINESTSIQIPSGASYCITTSNIAQGWGAGSINNADASGVEANNVES